MKWFPNWILPLWVSECGPVSEIGTSGFVSFLTRCPKLKKKIYHQIRTFLDVWRHFQLIGIITGVTILGKNRKISKKKFNIFFYKKKWKSTFQIKTFLDVSRHFQSIGTITGERILKRFPNWTLPLWVSVTQCRKSERQVLVRSGFVSFVTRCPKFWEMICHRCSYAQKLNWLYRPPFVIVAEAQKSSFIQNLANFGVSEI